MRGRRRAQQRDEQLTGLHAAGLSFAFAGDGHAAHHDARTPLWLLPAQPEAPHADSYDDAIDELVEGVLVEEAVTGPADEPADEPVEAIAAEPVLDARAAAILRLRSRL